MAKHRHRKHFLAAFVLLAVSGVHADDIWQDVEHGYADNDGVKIHYASIGEGPAVVMIHGFPDFWYSWRDQMNGLKDHFKLVAIDQRGYNRSDQPQGVENYDMSLLVGDVAAVIHALGEEQVTVVGHDWGGAVAWNVAFTRPDLVRNLVILDLPHPNGLANAWANNEEAFANTNYARVFRDGESTDPDIFFGRPMNAQTLSGWVRDEDARQKYVEAFERSDFPGMLNFYKQNYPDLWTPNQSPASLAPVDIPNIEVPTLLFHGLQDQALHSDALNNTWDWIDRDLTIVTAPDAGHFIQQDAGELVTTTMKWWLLARKDPAE
jgi:pimeloyl-ACP methyl ester carboxylesterase